MHKFIAILLLSSFAQAQMAQLPDKVEREIPRQLGQQASSETQEQPGTKTQLEMIIPPGVQSQNPVPSVRWDFQMRWEARFRLRRGTPVMTNSVEDATKRLSCCYAGRKTELTFVR